MDFTDQDALDAIARLMDANEWDSELMSQIAEIVDATSRPVEDEESWTETEQAAYNGLTSSQYHNPA